MERFMLGLILRDRIPNVIIKTRTDITDSVEKNIATIVELNVSSS